MDQITARTRAVLAGLLAAALLGVVGCGDDKDGDDNSQSGSAVPGASQGAASDAELDVCSLLDVTEIGEQFGDHGAVAQGVPSVGGTTSLCSWDVGDPAGRASGTGNLTLGVSRTVSQAIFDELTGNPVSGLGDEAVLAPPGTLHVRSGETYFNLIAGGFITEDPAEQGEQLTTLADAILARL